MSVHVLEGDCRDILPTLDRLDCCVTDPPYELGFMSKSWDRTGIAFQPETWWPVFTALKPGAHLVAFGGSRTFHRMVCAIEDAGFEIRDTLMYLYGTGFPKSYNLDGDRKGWGTALKPAYEPIILARRPLVGTVAQNVLAHGTGAIHIDACRIETGGEQPRGSGAAKCGTAAYSDFAGNGGNVTPDAGRWPANVLHDGSDEVLEAFAAFGERPTGKPTAGAAPTTGDVFGKYARRSTTGGGDTGTAARFFYTAKADKADRADSRHPTVKPVDLMRWLVRLVCPPGGTVLDPFAGSGTTGEAAMLEGMNAILIEQDAQHAADIRHRIRRWSGEDCPLFASAAD